MVSVIIIRIFIIFNWRILSLDANRFVTTMPLFSGSSVVWIVDRAKLYVDEGLDYSNAYCIYLSVHIEGIDLLIDISDFTTEFLSEFWWSDMSEHESERFCIGFGNKSCTQLSLFCTEYLFVSRRCSMRSFNDSDEMLKVFLK